MPTDTMPARGPYAAVAALLASPLPIPPDSPPRAALAAEIERLIDILDILDGDPDLEANGDLEPYLAGAPSYPIDDAELDDSEREHSLGSLDRASSQERWAEGEGGDYEHDDADDEMDTGNPLGARIMPGYVDDQGRVLSSSMRLEVERAPTKRVRRPVSRAAEARP